jgi:hypothetical protein
LIARRQLQSLDEVPGWQLGPLSKAEIDRILGETITDPVGPEFMASPSRSLAAGSTAPTRSHAEKLVLCADPNVEKGWNAEAFQLELKD